MSWNNQSETGWLKHIFDKLGEIYDKLVSGITTTPAGGTQDVNIKYVNSAVPTGTGATQVQGTAADGAAAVGSPVQVGGKDESNNIQSLNVDTSGVLRAKLWNTGDGLEVASFNSTVDGRPTTVVSLSTNSYEYGFNGTNWDRLRTNTGETVLASAARTIATNGPDMTNYNARGLHLIIDVTAFTAGSITITIQGKDPVSGKYYTILTSAALAAVATTVLRVYPDATIAANVSINDILPRTWRAIVAVSTADSVTYSIGANLVL